MIKVIKEKHSNFFFIDQNNQYFIIIYNIVEWQMIGSELTSIIKKNQLIHVS
jgi:hypothetical protein